MTIMEAPSFMDRPPSGISASGVSARERYAGYALFGLFFMAVVGLQVLQKLRGGSDLSGDGDIFRQLSYILVFLYTVSTQRVVTNLRTLMIFPMSLLLLMGWCWLSVMWAIEPDIAVRRLVLTTIIVVTVFLAVDNAGTERSLHHLRLLLVGTLLVNYLMVFASPTGVHLPGESPDLNLIGNWRGFMLQKNFAGEICAITILLFLFDPGRLNKFVRWIIIIAAAYFLLRSMSKTSIALMVPAILAGWTYLRFSARTRPLLIVGLVVLILIAAIFSDTLVGEVAGFLDGPDALTGRIQIWPILLEYAASNPIFGAGFGSFWNIGASSPVFSMSYSWVADLGNGHNGYLDVLVQLGIPGLALAVVAVVLLPIWRLLTSATIPSGTGALLLAVMVFCAFNNFTESSLLDRDMMVWVFMIFVMAMVRKAAMEAKLSDARPALQMTYSRQGDQ